MKSFKVKHYESTQKKPVARIEHPLAADVSDTGDTFEVAIDHINECTNPAEIRTAVLHHKIVSKYKPDYCTREVREWHWIAYPWASMEDMTAFIRKMELAPTCVENVAQKLRSEFNIEAPTQILSDAFKLSNMEFR